MNVDERLAKAVQMVKEYEKLIHAGNIARLLASAEQDVEQGKTRSFHTFIQEFKRDNAI